MSNQNAFKMSKEMLKAVEVPTILFPIQLCVGGTYTHLNTNRDAPNFKK